MRPFLLSVEVAIAVVPVVRCSRSCAHCQQCVQALHQLLREPPVQRDHCLLLGKANLLLICTALPPKLMAECCTGSLLKPFVARLFICLRLLPPFSSKALAAALLFQPSHKAFTALLRSVLGGDSRQGPCAPGGLLAQGQFFEVPKGSKKCFSCSDKFPSVADTHFRYSTPCLHTWRSARSRSVYQFYHLLRLANSVFCIPKSQHHTRVCVLFTSAKPDGELTDPCNHAALEGQQEESDPQLGSFACCACVEISYVTSARPDGK